jgi:hypothetical protein
LHRSPATSSARCIGRAGLGSFKFFSDRPERASDGLIVGAQLLRPGDNRRQHFEYRDNSPMTGIVFGIFGLASRPPRLKVEHALRSQKPARSGSLPCRQRFSPVLGPEFAHAKPVFRRLLPRRTYMSDVRLDIRRKSDAARGFIAYVMGVASMTARVASLAALSDSSSRQRALVHRRACLRQEASH